MNSKNLLLSNLRFTVLCVVAFVISDNAQAHLFICHKFPWMDRPYCTDYPNFLESTSYPTTYDTDKTAYVRFSILPDLKECWMINWFDECEIDWSGGVDDLFLAPSDKDHWIMCGEKDLNNLVIPDSITYNNTRIPVKGLKSVFNWADKMYDEDPDPSVMLPSTLEFIYNSFNIAPDLTSVELSKNIKIIERSFRYIPRIEEINLPDSLECICYESFNQTYFKTLSLPDKLMKIGNGCFNDMHNLETLTFGNNLYEIGEKCFNNLENVNHIILPENLFTVDIDCFNNIPELSTLEIKNPQSANVFTGTAFNNCPNLQTIIVHSREPSPSISRTSFVYVDFDSCIVMVPQGSEDSYRNAKGWERFKNIIANPASVNHITDDTYLEISPNRTILVKGSGSVEIYSIDGKLVGIFTTFDSNITLPHGAYIYKSGNNCKKIII